MAISEQRVSDFERRGPEHMARWLENAAIGYFSGDRGADSFRPFELFIGTAESTATEIRLAYDRLSTRGQIDFRTALVQTLSSLEPKPELTGVWKFLIELSWQLPEPGVMAILENRCNDYFLDSLCSNDSELFDHIFGYILNIPLHTQEAAKCIRRLARSSHYECRRSRLTLLRLCEIDPDNWTQHFSLLRDSVYKQFESVKDTHGLERMITVQDELARQIFKVTGFDRFIEGLPHLHSVKDAPVGAPSDNWYWRSLLERQNLILSFCVPDNEAVTLSSGTYPNERRPLPSPSSVIHVPPTNGDVTSGKDLENLSAGSRQQMAAYCLGDNVLEDPLDPVRHAP